MAPGVSGRLEPVMTNNAAMTPDVREVHTLIIGAGFGGLLTAIKLKQAGIDDFLILEKDEGVGGCCRQPR